MPSSPSVLIVVPFNATFTLPLKLAFRKLGFRVRLYDYRNITGNFLFQPFVFSLLSLVGLVKLFCLGNLTRFELLNEVLYMTCIIFHPRYLFVIKGEFITDNTIKRIKRLGVTTIMWQVDPSLDPVIWPFVDKYGRIYDVYVSCEPGRVVTELKKRGFRRVLYMLGAADGENMHMFNEPKKYDITLIGTFHPERARFLKALKNLDVHIWGWGDWQNSEVANKFHGKPLTQSEMLEVYKQSKIVLNIGRAIGSTIPTNLRPFEAAQVGAFILVDYKPNLKEIFKLGKEIITFKTPLELRQKVEYYIKHPEKREQIALAMFARVKRDHTYEIRLRKLFKEMDELSL